jgi:transcriptional regulator of acetoin/glycerol metabolism
VDALEQNHWRMTQTARALGISRATLYRKLQQHDISPSNSKSSS